MIARLGAVGAVAPLLVDCHLVAGADSGNSYVAVLQDKNNVLSEYSFHSDNPNVSFSVNENTLTIISQTAPTNDFTVTAEKKNAARKGLITWTDGIS